MLAGYTYDQNYPNELGANEYGVSTKWVLDKAVTGHGGRGGVQAQVRGKTGGHDPKWVQNRTPNRPSIETRQESTTSFWEVHSSWLPPNRRRGTPGGGGGFAVCGLWFVGAYPNQAVCHLVALGPLGAHGGPTIVAILKD